MIAIFLRGEEQWLIHFGAFDLEMACERLRAFAAEYGEGGPAQRYVVAGDALVEEGAVLANAPLVMRLIHRYRRLITVELPFTAARVIATSNIRILGLGPRADRTVRIQMRHGGGPSLRREVRARRTVAAIRARLEQTTDLDARIPEILRVGSNWLVEEQVRGRHCDKAEMHRFAETVLPRLYRHTLRQRPYRGPAPLSALEEETARNVPGFSPRGRSGLWPVSLCKGDLNHTNILRDDKFWMIDWEQAGVMAIAIDVASLCIDTSDLTKVALEILRAASTADSVPPAVQLTLGLAWHSLRLASYQAVAANRRRLGGTTNVAATESKIDQRAKVQSLMRTAFQA